MPGKPDVEDHDPDRVPVELDERLLAGAHPDHDPAVARQVAAHELADRRLVLDQEHVTRHETESRPGSPPATGDRSANRRRDLDLDERRRTTVHRDRRRRLEPPDLVDRRRPAGDPHARARVEPIVTTLPSGSRRVSERGAHGDHAAVVVGERVRDAPDDDVDRRMRPAGRQVRRRRQPDRPGAACEGRRANADATTARSERTPKSSRDAVGPASRPRNANVKRKSPLGKPFWLYERVVLAVYAVGRCGGVVSVWFLDLVSRGKPGGPTALAQPHTSRWCSRLRTAIGWLPGMGSRRTASRRRGRERRGGTSAMSARKAPTRGVGQLESLERCCDAYLETARSLGREGLSIRG